MAPRLIYIGSHMNAELSRGFSTKGAINMPNHSVERDVPNLRFGFPPPAAPAAPHVKR